MRKLHFLSSCQYTHGCSAPASWAAQHTTVCFDIGHTRMGKMQDDHNRVVDIEGADGDDKFDDSHSGSLNAIDRLA